MCHLSDEAAAALDAAIERGAEAHVRLLEELVRVPSVVGQESRAIDLLADRLEALGFDIRAVPLADALAEAPGGGRPLVPAAGRCALVGERAGAGPRSLLLNGHVDVVPPGDDALWASPPFSPAIRDGWLFGRGAGDMKGGIAMALLALAALVEAAPAALDGRVVAAFVPEEECTGNGTLATILAGATADVALLPEPTDLGVLVSGVGVSWVELEVRGEPAHAGSATDGVNPVDRLLVLVAALRDLGAAFEAEHPEAIARGERFHVNLGLVRAGEWTSSVPSSARGSVRIGYPAALAPADLERRVADAIARAAAADPWLARVPPHVRFVGLRAEPHALAVDHPLVEAVREAHRAAHGALPPVVHGAATSDARLYLNQAAMPALCYGPRARAIHGVDEAVELASIVDGARTLARAIAALLGTAP